MVKIKMNKAIWITAVLVLLLTTGVFAQVESNITENNTTQETTEENVISEIEDDIISIPEKKLILALDPEKNIAKPGDWAHYALKILDKHYLVKCVEREETASKCIGGNKYTYKLEFETDSEIEAEFEKEITLTSGESKIVKFLVKSKKQGANVFVINAIGEDARARTKGVLVVSEGTIVPPISTPEPAVYFIGTGFALNSDESKGKIVELKILKDNSELKGKVGVGKDTFKIKGTYSNGDVEFELLKVNSGELMGEFSGIVKKFNTFLLLRGNLEIQGEIYSLTATSKARPIFREIEIGEEKRKIDKARLQEMIILKEKEKIIAKTEIGKIEEIKEVKEEIYIKPIKIRREKILYIIPNPWGKKVLEMEFIDKEKVIKETIKEMEWKRIGKYNIEVGNLEDEENIELNIEEAE